MPPRVGAVRVGPWVCPPEAERGLPARDLLFAVVGTTEHRPETVRTVSQGDDRLALLDESVSLLHGDLLRPREESFDATSALPGKDGA